MFHAFHQCCIIFYLFSSIFQQFSIICACPCSTHLQSAFHPLSWFINFPFNVHQFSILFPYNFHPFSIQFPSSINQFPHFSSVATCPFTCIPSVTCSIRTSPPWMRMMQLMLGMLTQKTCAFQPGSEMLKKSANPSPRITAGAAQKYGVARQHYPAWRRYVAQRGACRLGPCVAYDTCEFALTGLGTLRNMVLAVVSVIFALGNN